MSERDSSQVARSEAARPHAEVPVRVRFSLHRSDNVWQSTSWRLAEVVQDDAGPLQIALFRDEAEGYYLNVTTTEPSIFVLWRHPESPADDQPPEAVAVSVSYNEAARWMDGGEQVDRVAMPAEMTAWLSEFVNLFYVPEQKRKRKGQKTSFMNREDLARIADGDPKGEVGAGST
jgi:hypothetical protein